MSQHFSAVTALRPSIAGPRRLQTPRRPGRKEDRKFFVPRFGPAVGDDYLPEGAADWGNRVLAEADFSSPLHP
jgi:hypothetical protein